MASYDYGTMRIAVRMTIDMCYRLSMKETDDGRKDYRILEDPLPTV